MNLEKILNEFERLKKTDTEIRNSYFRELELEEKIGKRIRFFRLIFSIIIAIIVLVFTISYLFSDTRACYITETGSKYHAEYCGYLWNSKIEITIAEAKLRGYTDCSKCSVYPVILPLLVGLITFVVVYGLSLFLHLPFEKAGKRDKQKRILLKKDFFETFSYFENVNENNVYEICGFDKEFNELTYNEQQVYRNVLKVIEEWKKIKEDIEKQEIMQYENNVALENDKKKKMLRRPIVIRATFLLIILFPISFCFYLLSVFIQIIVHVFMNFIILPFRVAFYDLSFLSLFVPFIVILNSSCMLLTEVFVFVFGFPVEFVSTLYKNGNYIEAILESLKFSVFRGVEMHKYYFESYT